MVINVDDRSFATPGINQYVSLWHQWQAHTAQLGMLENLGKTSSFALQIGVRRLCRNTLR